MLALIMNYTIEHKTKQNEDFPTVTSLSNATELPFRSTTHIVSQLMWDKDGELIKEPIH